MSANEMNEDGIPLDLFQLLITQTAAQANVSLTNVNRGSSVTSEFGVFFLTIK